MTDPLIQFDDLHDALSALVDGRLSAAEFDALHQHLLTDDRAMDEYLRFVDLDAELSLRSTPATTPAAAPAPARAMRLGYAFAAAAVIALGVGVWFVASSPTPPKEIRTSNAPRVAMLTDTQNAVFADADGSAASFALGGDLPAGPIRLASGKAQVMLASGAVVDLSGPGEIDLREDNSLLLRRGRLVAEVPVTAHGFTVVMDSGARIVDLGTEFGVQAMNRNTAIEVFKGKVLVEFGDQKQTLSVGQSVRLGDGAIQAVDPADSAFAEYRSYRRWMRLGRVLQQDAGALMYESFTPGQLLGDPIGAPQWAPGRFADKPALKTDGVDDALAIHVPGDFDQMTIALWVNVTALNHTLNDLLAADGTTGIHLHLTRDGRLTCARLGVDRMHTGVLINRADFGQWVHLAVVADHGAGELRVYRNGQLVHTQKTNPDPEPIHIGAARLGNWNPLDYAGGDRARGLAARLDELVILARAASPETIRQLYEAGAPAGPNKPEP